MQIARKVVLTFSIGLLVAAGLPRWACATAVTLSGTDLSDSNLVYRDNGGSAAYAPGTPDLAVLSSSDISTTGGAPIVYVRASSVGLPSLGTLGSFGASYDLYSSNLPNGLLPYWLVYLVDPQGGYVGVISFGGPDFDTSSQIHVFCDYASNSTNCSNDYWGDTLQTLDGIAYENTSFGQLQVYEAGVEIGDWNVSPVAGSVSIRSITVSTTPEPASLLLLGTGLAGLVFSRRRLGAPGPGRTATS
jgi:PEP-CTERM motif